MNKIKKIVAYSGSVALACTSLLGCASNPTDTYLKEIQNIGELKNYNFKHDIVMDMSIADQNFKLDFILEGEVVNEEWFYTKVVYKEKTLSDIMIKDDKVYLNVGSIARNLTTSEIVSTEIIQGLSIVHTMLFDAKDYLCIDLKDYEMTAKELISLFDTDSLEFYKTLNNVSLEEFKALVVEDKEVVTKEDDKYHLKMNAETINKLAKSITSVVEERKTELMTQLEDDIATVLSMEVVASNLPATYSEEEIKQLAVMQYDAFIQSMNDINDIETEISQTLFKEKDTYYSEYVFEMEEPELQVDLMINLDSALTDKKDSVEHTYSESVPEDSVSVEKLIENFNTYIGDTNVSLDTETLAPQFGEELAKQDVAEETITQMHNISAEKLEALGYEVNINDGYVSGEIEYDEENYLERSAMIGIEDGELSYISLEVEVDKMISEQEKENFLVTLQKDAQALGLEEVNKDKLYEAEKTGELISDGPFEYDFYSGKSYNSYEVTIYAN